MREKISRSIGVILVAWSAGYAIVYALFNAPWQNFIIGFFATLLITLATFLSHARRVNEAVSREEEVLLASVRSKEAEGDDEELEFALKDGEEMSADVLKRWRGERSFNAKNLWLGTRLSLSLFRLVAYAILIAGVLFLIRHELLHVLSLFGGILSAIFGLVCVVIIWNRRSGFSLS